MADLDHLSKTNKTCEPFMAKTQEDLRWTKIINDIKDFPVSWDQQNKTFIDRNTLELFTGKILFTYDDHVWVLNGKIHHPIKPAINFKAFQKHEEYWLESIQYSFEEFWQKQKNTQWSSQIMMYVLGNKNE